MTEPQTELQQVTNEQELDAATVEMGILFEKSECQRNEVEESRLGILADMIHAYETVHHALPWISAFRIRFFLAAKGHMMRYHKRQFRSHAWVKS